MNVDIEQKDKDKYSKKHYTRIFIYGIILVIILLIGLIASVITLRNETRIKGEAKTLEPRKVELANSYIFASPLKADAGGIEQIRITVFVLDSQGRGVVGKMVDIGNEPAIKIDKIRPQTDELGRAVFDISSEGKGYYLLEAKVDGKVIPQRVSVSFD